MKKRHLQFVAIILSIVFLFFTFIVHTDLFTALDLSTTEGLQKFIPKILDIPFSLFSLFGSLEIVLLILFILWVFNKKLNYFYILFFLGLFHVVEFIGKVFVNHPGPPFRFFRYDIPFLFPSSGVTTGSSFPSGHMGRTIFLSIIVIFLIYHAKRFSKFQKQIFYMSIIVFDLTMFISRIYLGEHWLSDILGATILGSSFALFSLAFL